MLLLLLYKSYHKKSKDNVNNLFSLIAKKVRMAPGENYEIYYYQVYKIFSLCLIGIFDHVI
ncbi:hypothetical protein IV49_GL002042 [Kandleria vitulina DSM 20405]|uniref:Uncharacterized protein n=1 Tax=Kandleria vitulina DSM 20405 TaxID=1410657 RepID=A0A0R2HM83_9FIRM|nr:hypothetical protein IV49_GL002042 [Kandleria vitulina DSM 20405]